MARPSLPPKLKNEPGPITNSAASDFYAADLVGIVVDDIVFYVPSFEDIIDCLRNSRS